MLELLQLVVVLFVGRGSRKERVPQRQTVNCAPEVIPTMRARALGGGVSYGAFWKEKAA